MKTILQMSEVDEAKALPILLRHSPGTVFLPRPLIQSRATGDKRWIS
jgi:hypothetical protein